jgi:putative CocE/NonD family hydrolase
MNGYRIEWGIRIPMRDGVRLSGVIYHPESGKPVPVTMIRTPYSSDTYHEIAKHFLKRNYACAVVDVRGRAASEGEFVPFDNEKADGYDCIEWLAAQPWCNGDVFTVGSSYGGMVQWQAASQRPPHLRAIAPTAPAMLGIDFPFHRGIFMTYAIQWLTLTSGKTTAFNSFADPQYWPALFRRAYREYCAYSELDRVALSTSTKFQSWVEHPAIDEFWDRMNVSPVEFAAIEVPILSISGLYDGDWLGTLAHYRAHSSLGNAKSVQRHYFVIGPWDHVGTRTPKRETGGLSFGPQALLDIDGLHVAFYEWAVGKAERPSFLKDRVAYYVAGLEEWRYAPSFDEIPSERKRLYLHADDRQGHDVFDSGRLDTEASAATPATYVYDPLDIRPADLLDTENPDLTFGNILRQQSAALNLFGNGLIYHSAPLEEDFVMTGVPVAHLFVSVDVPDTDLAVTLYAIHPDGSSIMLAEDKLRMRHRASLREVEFAKLGEIYECIFSDFRIVSQLIVKYSRIRLLVRCPNSPFDQKNYNSGGNVMYETRDDAKEARVTIHHAPPHASFIDLPVGDPVARQRLEPHERQDWFLAP